MNKDQIISKAASVIVGLLVTWVVAKLVNKRFAGIVGSAAAFVAHKKLDPIVAREVKRAVS